MLKIILFALPPVIVVYLLLVARQPSAYRVTRSLVVAAPPEAVFPHVNELKQWEAWNPWGKVDPAMKLTYEGPAAGVGAAHAWIGNHQVGAGRMTITASRPHELIQFNTEFYKPMAGVSTTEFTFKPEGRQTTVTWTMTGKNNFIAKAFCLFLNMDRMIGGQFENRLTNLKTVVEAGAKEITPVSPWSTQAS